MEYDETLTLGWGVAGLNIYPKGVSLGLFQPTPGEVKEQSKKMRNSLVLILGIDNFNCCLSALLFTDTPS